MQCITSKGGTLRKRHVSYLIDMMIVNISHVLAIFILIRCYKAMLTFKKKTLVLKKNLNKTKQKQKQTKTKTKTITKTNKQIKNITNIDNDGSNMRLL